MTEVSIYTNLEVSIYTDRILYPQNIRCSRLSGLAIDQSLIEFGFFLITLTLPNYQRKRGRRERGKKKRIRRRELRNSCLLEEKTSGRFCFLLLFLIQVITVSEDLCFRKALKELNHMIQHQITPFYWSSGSQG
ncbi:uncharacterized protein LOC133740495 isoform X2 [Rosa rugosa]|uniref:uncharacterized protein LOC133740495 isoform X2 n=1 Tax=Rosa rugosa TaxID=74645 RepID=UPI002B40D6E9|nr:uncharacterized protein LOC133740495 isoform X2 [Rosa rugosa]